MLLGTKICMFYTRNCVKSGCVIVGLHCSLENSHHAHILLSILESMFIQTEVLGHSLVHSLVHSFARTAHSFSCSRALLCSLVCSLDHFTHSIASGIVNDWTAFFSVFFPFWTILDHSAFQFLLPSVVFFFHLGSCDPLWASPAI